MPGDRIRPSGSTGRKPARSMPPLSTALTEVSLTSITSALTCPDGGLFVVISCLVHDVVQGGGDARASGGGPRFGDAIVDCDGGRRRAGRPGGQVPRVSDRYRPVAEHGEGVLARPQGLLGVPRLPRPGLARGPAGGRRGVRRLAAAAPGWPAGRGRGAAVRDIACRCLDGEPQARGSQRVRRASGPQWRRGRGPARRLVGRRTEMRGTMPSYTYNG